MPEEQQDGSESDRPLYADVCFEVEEYRFYGHKVQQSFSSFISIVS